MHLCSNYSSPEVRKSISVKTFHSRDNGAPRCQSHSGCSRETPRGRRKSAVARAKPIALTGIAAMLGALFILDDPIFNGLAISLVFGILVSTLLTLVVIPVLYYAVNRVTIAS